MAKKENQNQPKDLIEPTPEEIKKMEEENKKISEKMIEESEEKEEKEAIKKIDESNEKKTFSEMKAEREKKEEEEKLASWAPKTQTGKDVKSGKEKDIDNILDSRKKILESEIVDSLLHIESDLLLIGQAKGIFGGGKRRAWRQTQRKTKEENPIFFENSSGFLYKKIWLWKVFNKA